VIVEAWLKEQPKFPAKIFMQVRYFWLLSHLSFLQERLRTALSSGGVPGGWQ
jgi:hypothetical protein